MDTTKKTITDQAICDLCADSLDDEILRIDTKITALLSAAKGDPDLDTEASGGVLDRLVGIAGLLRMEKQTRFLDPCPV